jgi:hypothetical protein
MNVRHGIALLCMTCLPATALADDAHHPDEKKAKAPAAKPAAKGQMRENMMRMQDQMAKIRAENDPVKRGQLIDEHMKSMQESMPMMRDMMGGKSGMGGGK